MLTSAVHFRALHPLFGTTKKPSPLYLQERSPYYWWWAFLRRNTDYLACCEAGGTGALSTLYGAFGDVRHDTFKQWWRHTSGKGELPRGARLFGERRLELTLRELGSAAEWEPDWRQDDVMVIAASLHVSKKNLRSLFAKLVKKRHVGRRGRKTFADAVRTSTALYKLHRVADTHALKIQLQVYDACSANEKAGNPKTLADIGIELGLMRSQHPKKSDDSREIAHKRIVMTAAVSRYYRHAKRIVANTAQGQFPNSE